MGVLFIGALYWNYKLHFAPQPPSIVPEWDLGENMAGAEAPSRKGSKKKELNDLTMVYNDASKKLDAIKQVGGSPFKILERGKEGGDGEKQEKHEYKVSGVMGNRQAIIDGDIYEIGDTLSADESKLLTITKDYIEIMRPNKKKEKIKVGK